MPQKLTEAQEQWLTALETSTINGKPIGQTKYFLWNQLEGLDYKSYCCLGVATQLFDPDSENLLSTQSEVASDANYASDKTTETLGLYSREGDPKALWLYYRERGPKPFSFSDKPLANLNDTGKTFKEIAAIIRDDPSVYFRSTFQEYSAMTELEIIETLTSDWTHSVITDSEVKKGLDILGYSVDTRQPREYPSEVIIIENNSIRS